MICLAVKYKIKAGKEKPALDIFKKLAAESRFNARESMAGG